MSEVDPLSGKLLLTKRCPDCNAVMRHSADYSYFYLDIFVCQECGCRIEVFHGDFEKDEQNPSERRSFK